MSLITAAEAGPRWPQRDQPVRSTRHSWSRALPDALRKLNPLHQWRSPVMFVVWVGSVATTLLAIQDPSAVQRRRSRRGCG